MKSKFLNFWFLWPLAHLFHFQWGYYFHVNQDYSVFFLAILINFTAMLCLLKPSKAALLSLASFQLAQVLILLPDVPNHWLLISLINLNLLFNFTLAKLKKETELTFWENFRQSTCWSVIIFYSWAMFWKLNHGFTNYETSCAVKFALMGLTIPTSLQKIIPHLVLLVELLIPLTLLVSRFRKVGVLLAILFHAALLLPAEKFFLNFSFTMMALVLLFINQNHLKFFHTDYEKYSKSSLIIISIFLVIIITATNQTGSWFYLRQLFALILYSAAIFHFLRSFRSITTTQLKLPQLSLVLVPAIVLINGLSPIVGLKSSSAWQMYSNLNLSEKSSNHYLISRSLGIGGYLEDRIKIISSRDLNPSEEYPYFLLTKYCHQNKCHNLNYDRNGVRIQTNGEAEKKDYLSRSILEKKLLTFNTFNVSGKDCRW